MSMKHLRHLILTLFLIPCLLGLTQNKTAGYLTEAYRFESTNSQVFSAYAGQAENSGLPRVSLFFKAIAKSASIHADNFQKVLSQMGVTVAPTTPAFTLKTPRENAEDAFSAVRTEAGIKYTEYLEQASADGEMNAAKALRWAKETEQQSLQLYTNVITAIANNSSSALPSLYWVCPKCGNLYDVPTPEKECSFCYTEREKFIKIQ
ncbi:MAG: rubrerythrin family protein [Bacteroidetes bacterium]|nr:MAG: rubrerythrin family protein [Bacteroidota bacterium]